MGKYLLAGLAGALIGGIGYWAINKFRGKETSFGKTLLMGGLGALLAMGLTWGFGKLFGSDKEDSYSEAAENDFLDPVSADDLTNIGSGAASGNGLDLSSPDVTLGGNQGYIPGRRIAPITPNKLGPPPYPVLRYGQRHPAGRLLNGALHDRYGADIAGYRLDPNSDQLGPGTWFAMRRLHNGRVPSTVGHDTWTSLFTPSASTTTTGDDVGLSEIVGK